MSDYVPENEGLEHGEPFELFHQDQHSTNGHDLTAEIPDDVPSGPSVKATPWDDLDEEVKNRIRCAHDLLKMGARIIELKAGSKRPKGKKADKDGHRVYLRTPADIKRALSVPDADGDYPNFGIEGSDVLLIADQDAKEGKQGPANLKHMIEEHGDDWPADTLKVKTPSGGLHDYLLSNGPVPSARTPDIEWQAGVNYVVGPYCRLIEGKCDPKDTPGLYEIVSGSTKSIAPRPSWTDKVLTKGSKKTTKHREPVIPWNLPESIEAARQCILRHGPAIQNQNGDDHTYALFKKLGDYAVAEQMAVILATEPMEELGGKSWNETCVPPWYRARDKRRPHDEQSLEDKAASAYSGTREEAFGSKSPAFTMSFYNSTSVVPDVADEPEEKTPAVTIVERSFGDILEKDPVPVVDIWDGFVERSLVNFLAGEGFGGKSGLMIQVGIGCAAGLPDVLGQRVESCRFGFFSAEDEPEEIDRRVHRIAKGMDLTPNQLDMVRDRAKTIDRYGRHENALAVVYEDGEPDLKPFYDELREWIDKQPEHVLIVLDSAYNFVRFPGKAKISEEAVRTYVQDVLAGLVGPKSTLWLPWHPSAAGLDRGDGSGWSVAWVNAPRLRATMAREKDKNKEYTGRVILSVPGRNHAPAPEPIALVRNRAGIFERGDAVEFKGETNKNAVELLDLERRHKEALAWLIYEVDKISKEPNGPEELGLKDSEGLELRRTPVARAIEAGLMFTNRRLSQRWEPYADEAEMSTSYSYDQMVRLLEKYFFEKGTNGRKARVKERWRVAGMDRWYMRVSAKGMFYFGDE